MWLLEADEVDIKVDSVINLLGVLLFVLTPSEMCVNVSSLSVVPLPFISLSLL